MRARLSLLVLLLVSLAAPPLPRAQGVGSCSVALLLAIDVSNSIDAGEYRIQANGLADALLDPEVREALVLGGVTLAVVQWSGLGQQVLSFDWRQMRSDADVLSLAAEARQMERAIFNSDTAIGDMIRYGLRQFSRVDDCNRWVIDVSGDGDENAGTDVAAARRAAERLGVQINGLAIENMGVPVTNYYRLRVITRDGFVMTSRGHASYAETLIAKLRREVAQVMF